MGDDNKLGLIRHIAHVVGKTNHVGIVQCGLDLVHDAEGRGAYFQNGEIQGDSHEGALAAGQQGNRTQSLSGRLGLDLDAAVQDVIGILQFQRGLTAAKQFQEGLGEGRLNGLELLGKDHAHFFGDLGDNAFQLRFGFLHVVALLGQISITLVDTLIFLDGVQIDIAQTGNRAFQFADSPLCLTHVFQLHTLLTGSLVRQLVRIPQLVQKLTLLHGGREFLLLQHRYFTFHSQQFRILIAAVLICLDTLSFQRQLFFAQAADLIILLLIFGTQSLQDLLLLQNLSFQRFVVRLKALHHIGTLFTVAVDVPTQPFQLSHSRFRGRLFTFQGRQMRRCRCDFAADGSHLLLQVILTLGLALSLSTQSCGSTFQFGDALLGLCRICLCTLGAGLDLLQFAFQDLAAVFQFCHLIPCRSHTLFQLQNGVLVFAALGHGGFHFVVGGGQLAAGLLQNTIGTFQIFRQLLQLLTQPLQFVGTGKNTRTLAGRTTGHGTAGVQHLAVQSDQFEAMTVLTGNSNSNIHILRNDHTAQQVGEYFFVFGIELNQLVTQTNDALFIHDLTITEISRTDGSQRQECGTACIAALQVLDGGLTVFLTVHHDMLHGAAQSGFDCHGILVRHMDQSGDRAVDSAQISALGIGHDYLNCLGITLVHLLHFGEHMNAGVQIVLLHLQIDLFLLCVSRLFLAGLQTHFITGNDIA